MTDAISHPGRLLAISGACWQASTLHAAVKLDVFSAIGDGSASPAKVAEAIEADPRAVSMLLNALTAMDLLCKEGDVFANTEESRNFLVKSAPGYVGYIIGHHHHLGSGWRRLDEAVRSGRPVRGRISFDDPDVRRNFLLGMFNIASLLAPRVAERVDLSGKRRLLDLGGGPGTYAIHFCLKYDQLEAAVFDRPATRPFAEETIARFGLERRIAFLAGDYLTAAIPGSYDVAWVSHILHAEGPQVCGDILQKVYDGLAPGGLILVHDFILDESMDGPLFPALFSLNMLQGTDSGQAYSRGEIESMLQAAGFMNITPIGLGRPNDSGIVAATK
ncbi:MAG: SAM-dependent methyltransferase [Desulfosarcina sp.]|nr:SAM-dependent methyltransferase [Desulfobacterales bacterium]